MALRDIIGQDKALRILRGTLRRDRVPSAMLLSGDAGVGKRLAAVNYAKALNCLNPSDFDCCDECPSCKKIDAGTHPDVTVLIPEEDEIKIDAIRRLEEVLFLKAFEGKKKIVIIDDADIMNINAANAFLKTLEEPPQDSLIILVSSNPDRLPDTIRSRCTTVRFYPLPAEGCMKVVSGALQAEDAGTILKLMMGRPGLALSKDLISEKEWFMQLLGNMMRGESKDAWEDKAAIRSWLDMALIYVRDRAVYAITGNEADLLYGKGKENQGARGRGQRDETAERGGPSLRTLFDAYQGLLALKGILDFNLNKSISWNYVANMMRMVVGSG